MKKILLIIILFMLISGTACSNTSIPEQDNIDYQQMYEAVMKDQAPLIKDITFKTIDGKVIEEEANWFTLEKQVRIIVTLEGDCQQIELFVTPTGTETYKLQKLIDEVTPNQNVAEYIWEVPDYTMGHFNIIAYNRDVGRRSDYYNVYYEPDTTQQP